MASQYAPINSNYSLFPYPHDCQSPSLSLKSSCASGMEGSLGGGTPTDENGGAASRTETINLQIFIPDLQMQKCLTVSQDELIWDVKKRLFEVLPQQLGQSFNFGFFLPPCDGRAGKFLLEDRPIRDYPFHDCAPYVEVKFKKRVYKMMNLDEKALKQVHSKINLRKFLEYVKNGNAEKVERMCSQGFDPNFQDSQGETPLTIAAGTTNSRDVLIQLIGGGAHLDFRNAEGQTAMHKAAYLSLLESLKTLLELGGSPNYKDPLGLTPLYYCMLSTDSSHEVAEMLLAEAADITVRDMHANEPLHQACKNGLVRHVEHLLYYGANVNAQNINGNTPLHVCAVNNRPDCARVLLFRGADPTLPNNNGQTAIQVAQIVNNPGVVGVIQCHNPQNSVPHRGVPQYSTRRRLANNNRITRQRSLSHSSMSSLPAVNNYQTPELNRPQPMMGISPSPSCATVGGYEMSGNYSTLRRYPAERVRVSQAGFEENVPRILVIPRGPRGFGFILRGTNNAIEEAEFEPTPDVPALQFFEGVEMNGMAIRAGLRPGDFLMEINGVDVRCASHEQVVELIHKSSDTITLKVMTVNKGTLTSEAPSSPAFHHNGAALPATAMVHRRNSSVSAAMMENGTLPPLPPQRHPTTSLSFRRDESDCAPDYQAIPFRPQTHTLSQASAARSDLHSSVRTSQSMDSVGIYSHSQLPSASISHALTSANTPTTENAGQGYPPADYIHNSRFRTDASLAIRCASVKARPSAARRISAAELEHLMVRHSANGTVGTSQFQPIQPTTPVAVGTNGPRKLAELKRRKQRGVDSPSAQAAQQGPAGGEAEPVSLRRAPPPFPLKSFNSSPELQYQDPRTSYSSNNSGAGCDANDNYSRPLQPVLRPKTPPPPPPPMPKVGCAATRGGILAPSPHHQPSTDYKDSRSGGVPAPVRSPATGPPPPPPINLLLSAQQSSTKQEVVTEANMAKAFSSHTSGNGGDCRGISPAALQSVRLKPTVTVVKGVDVHTGSKPAASSLATTTQAKHSSGSETEGGGGKKATPDFHSDLRNALARRRNKTCTDEETTTSSNSGNTSSSEDREGRTQRWGSTQGSSGLPTQTATPNTLLKSKCRATIVNGKPPNGNNQAPAEHHHVAELASTPRYAGLSLKDAVRENVQPGNQPGKTQNHHSPPCGFVINKKDSGYTSSRTSLEPSECGEDAHSQQMPAFASPAGTKYSMRSSALMEEVGTTIRIPIDSADSANATPAATSPPSPHTPTTELLLSDSAQAHRVTLISKQLEDSYGTERKPPVLCAGNRERIGRSPPKNDALAYDQQKSGAAVGMPTASGQTEPSAAVEVADSGHGDSDQDVADRASVSMMSAEESSSLLVANRLSADGGSVEFVTKKLASWTTVDVADWLCHLQLHEHVAAFTSKQITGKDLASFNRTNFIKLGVTRIEHRQLVEHSLQKDYN